MSKYSRFLATAPNRSLSFLVSPPSSKHSLLFLITSTLSCLNWLKYSLNRPTPARPNQLFEMSKCYRVSKLNMCLKNSQYSCSMPLYGMLNFLSLFDFTAAVRSDR